jgi:hypothetical protein
VSCVGERKTRSASVSKMSWSGKRDLLLSESVFLKMLIVRKRKATQRKRSPTNAIYFQREIYGEFHHLYEEVRNISRGPHPTMITVVFNIPKNASAFHFTNYKFHYRFCHCYEMQNTQLSSHSAFPVVHSPQQNEAMRAIISKYVIWSTAWP